MSIPFRLRSLPTASPGVARTAVRTIVLAGALLAGGCGVSAVEVESGLEKLRFHSNMHVVQAGETLETVAFRYRLRPDELLALNPGASGGLRPGMRINVRPGTELARSVRDGARVAPGPGTADRAPVPAQAAARAPIQSPILAPPPELRAAAPRAPAPSYEQPAYEQPAYEQPAPGTRAPTTIVATAPAAAPPRAERLPAVSGTGTAPLRAPVPAPDMAISETPWNAPLQASAHPREEVIPDDLGPLSEPIGPSGPIASDGQPEQVEVLAAYRPVPGGTAQAPFPGAAWVWPTAGQIARGFAPERVDGQGIDIAGQPGQDVRAAAAGTVIYSGKSLAGDGGNLVILRHDDGLMTTYAHTDRLFVTEDDRVRAGDPIASLGSNEAFESVLSFEVRRAGETGPLDPLRFLTPR